MRADENRVPYWPPDPERLSPYWPPIRRMPFPANDDRRHREDESQRFVIRSAILSLMPVPETFPDAPDLGLREPTRPYPFRDAAAEVFDFIAYACLLERTRPWMECPWSGSEFEILAFVYPAVYKKPAMQPANLP